MDLAELFPGLRTASRGKDEVMVLRRRLAFLPVAAVATIGLPCLGALVALVALPGCGGGGTTSTPPATYSFTTDVMPIFQTSCAFSGCHGSMGAPAAGMDLGADAAQVYDNLVNVTSTEYPAMVRIKPGDPANSYLLHRVDDDANTLPDCTSVACTELMPQDGLPLAATDLATIRGWISEGAPSDLVDAGSSPDAGTIGDAAALGAGDASGD
jgi:hypothetical protein